MSEYEYLDSPVESEYSSDDEYISNTMDELNAKVDENEAQRSSFVGLLLETLRNARDLDETLDVEELAKITYAKIDSTGGDSSKLEAMLSPLFQLCRLSRRDLQPCERVEDEVDLAALEETESNLMCKLVNELPRQIEKSEGKIKQLEKKVFTGKLALVNTLIHIKLAEADIAAGKEVCKEADFAKLRLSEFYDQAEDDLERFMDENGNWYVVLVHLQCSKKCLEEEIARGRDMLVLERRSLKHLQQLEGGYTMASTMVTSAKKKAQLKIDSIIHPRSDRKLD